VQLASIANIGGYGVQAFPVTTPVVKSQSGYQVAAGHTRAIDPPALGDPPAAPPVIGPGAPPFWKVTVLLPPAPLLPPVPPDELQATPQALARQSIQALRGATPEG